MRYLNFETNMEELNFEDEDSVSSGTSDLKFLLGVSPSKDDDACMEYVLEFWVIMLGLNTKSISAVYL